MEENYNVQTQVELSDSQASAQLQKMVDDAFSKALAAAIMSNFPVASIIAIFFGVKSLKLIADIDEFAERYGLNAGGKRIAAKILGMVGKIVGIVMTAIYGAFFAFYVFLIMFYIFIGVMAIMFA